MTFSFSLHKTDGNARTGLISTPRGDIRTPAFMPVGTQGTVKGMYMDQIRDLGADIILGNTYHLMLRPGAERVAKLGGLHKFGGWTGPILTDSGGFQVMSLVGLRKLTEDNVTFRSHIDGAKYVLSPERSVEIQGLLGADIQMQLDECVKLPADEKTIEKAMELSLRWAERSRKAFELQPAGRALFGIVQGGDVSHLRVKSANELTQIPFEGYSIGGLAVGEPQAVMLQMLEVVEPHLPANKPRYLMGVGTPDDLLALCQHVTRGMAQFSPVLAR
jgi:queuine tRNA-ribosyltransferase